MKLLPLLLIGALFGAGAAHGQERLDEHSAHHVAPPAAPAASHMTAGEVRRILKDANKITLRHGKIENLDMPPMTMVFNVRESSLLDEVKVGDKVLFTAEQAPDGGLFVTAIKPVP